MMKKNNINELIHESHLLNYCGLSKIYLISYQMISKFNCKIWKNELNK